MWIVWKVVRSRFAREALVALIALVHERLTEERRHSEPRSRRRPRDWDEEEYDERAWR